MFYFFKRGAETLQCEVRHAADGDGYEIVISEGGKPDRVERHATSDQVHSRWLELHRTFQYEGWWGPATQDGRG